MMTELIIHNYMFVVCDKHQRDVKRKRKQWHYFSHHDCPLCLSLHPSTSNLSHHVSRSSSHFIVPSFPPQHPLPVFQSVNRVIGQQRCSLA